MVIGRLGRPHGLKGALHARPTGATLPELEAGERLWARTDDGRLLELVLAGSEGDASRLRVSFSGVDDREGATALAGAELCVAEDRVASPPDEDTFLVRDLIGCRVRLGERELGAVSEVHSLPANDVFEVRSSTGGDPTYVPFTADAIVAIDPRARLILARPDLFD